MIRGKRGKGGKRRGRRKGNYMRKEKEGCRGERREGKGGRKRGRGRERKGGMVE